MDNIDVPTAEYILILEKRGFNPLKMRVFKRGIDWNQFSPVENAKKIISDKFKIKKGYTLLYAGRISKDKNLDFIMDVYKSIIEKRDNVNMLVVGDGPYLSKLKDKMKNYERVIFTGAINRNDLAEIYSGSDVLLFPSCTDTFGMVVLEAQCCGLPAIVSDIGGPKEIILDGVTGYIADYNDIDSWRKKINNLLKIIDYNPDLYKNIKEQARSNIVNNYNWDSVIERIVN